VQPPKRPRPPGGDADQRTEIHRVDTEGDRAVYALRRDRYRRIGDKG
jgi:hypothetical protein